jgi:PEP-CTERM motif-containing protein
LTTQASRHTNDYIDPNHLTKPQNSMKSLIKKIASCALLAAAMSVNAATFIVDSGAPWLGFMNVFLTGGPGYGSAGAGGYAFGSGWGKPDLKAVFGGTTLTLSANTIGDPSSYWYTPSGMPGAVGNKIMDANIYQEFTGSLSGTTVTFTGAVLGNTLAMGPVDAAGHGWTSVAFVKDFAPDYSSSVSMTVPLTPGVFAVSLATIPDPLRHVQFGFETIGPDVWAGDPLSVPSVVIAAIPEPTALALAGLGITALLIRRRRN